MTKDLRGEPYIDSRDVIERHEELKDELEAQHAEAVEDEPETVPLNEWVCAVAENSDDAYNDEATEFIELSKLIDQAEGYGDFKHGETLIADYKFQEYAEQLAEDIGAIDRNATWPLTHIDWDAAAEALKSDYTEVEFNGVTYLMRA